jgi:hypothetical protein
VSSLLHISRWRCLQRSLFQDHCNAHRGACCGLLHEDYDLFAQVLEDMKNFDCEFYILYVEKFKLRGDTICSTLKFSDYIL